jgi:hypothetical protein
MAVIIIPRGWVQSASWKQPPVYSLQRSEWTGRTRVIEIGPAARWVCEADIAPTQEPDLRRWRAFQARMMSPGNVVRLPAVEVTQYGAAANLVRRPDGTGWELTGVGITQGLAPGAAPLRRTIRALPDAAQRLASEVSAFWAPAAPGDVRYFAASVLRETTTSGGNITMRGLWRTSAGGALGSPVSVIANSAPVGTWTRFYASGTAPASSAFIGPQAIFANTAGIVQATDFYIGDRPERALVNGAGQTGISLNVNGLAPDLLHLRAGHLVTVTLPGGDEQLLALTADVVADGAGAATLQLATPMRASPANGAAVELSRPWALMRATNPIGWNVSSGPVYRPTLMRFEEAF